METGAEDLKGLSPISGKSALSMKGTQVEAEGANM